MKNLIWNLIQKIFTSNIQNLVREQITKKTQEEQIKKVLVNYPLGTKIISQSNEPDELVVGVVVAHESIKDGIMLTVETEDKKRITLFDNSPMIWKKEREDTLRKLEWDERYNVMSKNHYYINKETKTHKESQEYRNRNNHAS